MARKEIDFNDEEAVLAEIARELDIDPDDLTIKENRNFGSFRTGTVYEIGMHRGGQKEWIVVENEGQEEELAIEIVKQDLENEPEIFNKDFIESHINMTRLRDDLHDDVRDMAIEDLTDMAERRPDDFWREYERAGWDAPEEDEDGERPDPDDSQIEELADKQADDRLKDPMEYLEDIYGDDAAKKAIEIAGIDIDDAAADAVNADGAGHFLSSYDGSTYTTKNGLVYWRTN